MFVGYQPRSVDIELSSPSIFGLSRLENKFLSGTDCLSLELTESSFSNYICMSLVLIDPRQRQQYVNIQTLVLTILRNAQILPIPPNPKEH